MTAYDGGPAPTIHVCEQPGCYIWTPHTHIPGVTGVTLVGTSWYSWKQGTK